MTLLMYFFSSTDIVNYNNNNIDNVIPQVEYPYLERYTNPGSSKRSIQQFEKKRSTPVKKTRQNTKESMTDHTKKGIVTTTTK